MYDGYRHLRIERRANGVLVITLDNPPTNAITQPFHSELSTIFSDINRDADTKVVVLTGAGNTFSAGGDIAQMQQTFGDTTRSVKVLHETRQMLHGLLALEKPIIARI